MSNEIVSSRELVAAFMSDVAFILWTCYLSMSDSKGPQDGHQVEERLSPGQVANFAGSLVVNNLDVAPKATVVRGNRGKAAAWANSFTERGDEIGIWKSAVSIIPPRLVKI